MVCPFCFYKETRVYNSRTGARLNIIWRRRRCSECGAEFTTHESADPGTILAVKDHKTITPLSHSKLLITLLKVLDHRTDQDESAPYLASTVEQKLYRQAADSKKPSLTKQQLVDTISETLQRYDPVAYIKYLSQHQNMSRATLKKALE